MSLTEAPSQLLLFSFCWRIFICHLYLKLHQNVKHGSSNQSPLICPDSTKSLASSPPVIYFLISFTVWFPRNFREYLKVKICHKKNKADVFRWLADNSTTSLDIIAQYWQLKANPEDSRSGDYGYSIDDLNKFGAQEGYKVYKSIECAAERNVSIRYYFQIPTQ